MNTPAHLLIGAAAFGRRDKRGTTLAAMAGSLAPDVSLYVMVAVSMWVLNIDARVIFGDLYYSDAWQAVFAVDNSFLIWGAGLAIAIYYKAPRAVAFAAGGLLHLALDLPLHTHDARMHFWPLTDWVFESPVSYWDTGAHANLVRPIELALSAVAAVVLFLRFRVIWFRALVIVLMVAELVSTGIWQFFF
ncbi:MAG: cobalamin biosynthesis protein CobQ [Pseudomonadota bacterium]